MPMIAVFLQKHYLKLKGKKHNSSQEIFITHLERGGMF